MVFQHGIVPSLFCLKLRGRTWGLAPLLARSRMQATRGDKPTVQRHVCLNKSQCLKCRYIRLQDKWEAATPILQPGMSASDVPPDQQHLAAGSWLSFRVLNDVMDGSSRDDPPWAWGCIVCKTMHPTEAPKMSDDSRAWASFTVRSSLQLANLRRHHNLPAHKSAVMSYLGMPTLLSNKGAPSSDMFRKVYADIQKGISPAAGIQGVGRSTKIWRMVHSLAEALRIEARSFFMNCTTLRMMRDERAGRLFVRLAGATPSLERGSMAIGISKGHGTGADAHHRHHRPPHAFRNP